MIIKSRWDQCLVTNLKYDLKFNTYVFLAAEYFH
jgi:hypothetical protein